jgi:hypothetical protein
MKPQLKAAYYNRRDEHVIDYVDTLAQAELRLTQSKRNRVWVKIPKNHAPLFGDVKNPDFVEIEDKKDYYSYKLIYKKP